MVFTVSSRTANPELAEGEWVRDLLPLAFRTARQQSRFLAPLGMTPSE